jgi:zinc-ribbon domain/Sel1 repeat
VRCPRCGNENPEGNRFCGMCGATVLQAPAPAVSAQGQGAADSGAPIASRTAAPAAPSPPPRAATPVTEDSPIISGPSFLGLNQPAPASSSFPPKRRGNLSIDPHSAPSSRSLDYLLDDEEEPEEGGGWKFVVMLLALALAVGVGYFRWKAHGFDGLISDSKKPAAAIQPADSPDANSSAPSAAPANEPPAAAPSVAPAATTKSQPAASAAPATSASAPKAPVAAPISKPSGSDATPPASASEDGGNDSESNPSSSAPAAAKPATKDSDAAPDDTAPAAPPASEKARAAVPKPSAKPTAAIRPPARVADPVVEAQKYLYGKGAPQDCDRGMHILKPAAEQANAKAMIEMGALYSAGLCTPRDLPTAYRWFAMALRKDPDNLAVQTDLQKLWGEMTQPERQLAIRLSQ